MSTAHVEGNCIHVDTPAGRFRLERPANLEDLWQAMTEQAPPFEDERLPYWCELWPSSLALADWLCAHSGLIRNASCLDAGCGLGLISLLCARLGAEAIGLDYEQAALEFARRNALGNNLPEAAFVLMDWRRPALRAGSQDFILAADIMYEKRFARPLLSFFAHCLRPGGKVWLAEPGRQVFSCFEQNLLENGWSVKIAARAEVQALYPQECPVPVRIWEISTPLPGQ